MLSIDIDPEIARRLEALGAKTETNKGNFFGRQALLDELRPHRGASRTWGRTAPWREPSGCLAWTVKWGKSTLP